MSSSPRCSDEYLTPSSPDSYYSCTMDMDNTISHAELTPPLLRLPAELRNRIYRHLLCDKTWAMSYISELPFYTGSLTYSACETSPSFKPVFLDLQHAMKFARTCRQNFSEASLFAFSKSTFSFTDAHDFIRWLATIPVMQRDATTRVELQCKLEIYRSYIPMSRQIVKEIRVNDVHVPTLIFLPYLQGILNMNLSFELAEGGDSIQPGKGKVKCDACIQRWIYTARRQVKALMGNVEVTAQDWLWKP